MLRQQTHLGGEFVLGPQVIGVLKRDDVSLRDTDPPIARRGRSATVLEYVSHWHVTRVGNSARHPRCAVGRAIIHDNDLQRPVVLDNYTPQSVADEWLTVMDRHDNADNRVRAPHGRRPAVVSRSCCPRPPGAARSSSLSRPHRAWPPHLRPALPVTTGASRAWRGAASLRAPP